MFRRSSRMDSGKKAVFLFCLLASVTSITAMRLTLENEWTTFKGLHRKSYKEEEEKLRFKIFEENLAFIAKHNFEADLGKHSYRLGINEWSDMRVDEFNAVLNGFRTDYLTSMSNSAHEFLSRNASVPEEVDYRTMDMVTSVKNQGFCGSCYAFSAVGALEGQWRKKKGSLHSLSPQNIVDCSRPEANNGCDGGSMDKAFKYVMRNKGIDTEASYPYEGFDNTCRYRDTGFGATCEEFIILKAGDEYLLKKATAATGPISVGLNGRLQEFQHYSSGVFYNPRCDSDLNHAMLIVGYGTYKKDDYWILKNSYGPTWGEDGYMRIARNKGSQCGISTYATFPVVL